MPVSGTLCSVLLFSFFFFGWKALHQVQRVVAREPDHFEEGAGSLSSGPSVETVGIWIRGWQDPKSIPVLSFCVMELGFLFMDGIAGSIPSQENPTKAFISS